MNNVKDEGPIKQSTLESLALRIRKLASIILGDYTVDKDPAFKKIQDALVAAGRNDWSRAQAFLSQVGQAIETKERGYKEKVPALKGLRETYQQAMDLCKEQNPAAVEKLTILVDTLKKTEKEVNNIMYPNRYRP
jgi:polyhydroxyalkanoate synthesis regulator phasin